MRENKNNLKLEFKNERKISITHRNWANELSIFYYKSTIKTSSNFFSQTLENQKHYLYRNIIDSE